MKKLALLAVVLGSWAGCTPIPMDQADPLRAVPRGEPGRPVLSLRWKLVTSDRSREVKPQEFASPVVYKDHVYTGSEGGKFYALGLKDGHVWWDKELGAISSRPVVDGGFLYVGTDDGILICLDLGDKDPEQGMQEVWRHATHGPILERPVVARTFGEKPSAVVVFANEADQVYALDATTGEFKWQYKADSPEEYTLRGHAGVTIGNGLVYTGFANGTLVALRLDNGSVAWLTSLKGDSDRFVDVDATPELVGDTLYVSSSSGGVWALDAATGLVRWRAALDSSGSTGPLAADDERLYAGVADVGVHALDLGGNVLWRQGTRGGGEPGELVVDGDYLFYTLADAGLFVADKHSGETLQYFDPGDGFSGRPVISDDQLFAISNRGVLYAFDIDRF